MSEKELNLPEIRKLRDAIANVPKGAKPTLTETFKPLKVREFPNDPAEFGSIRPTKASKTKPPYPDITKTSIEPNTRPAKQQRAFKPSRGEN